MPIPIGQLKYFMFQVGKLGLVDEFVDIEKFDKSEYVQQDNPFNTSPQTYNSIYTDTTELPSGAKLPDPNWTEGEVGIQDGVEWVNRPILKPVNKVYQSYRTLPDTTWNEPVDITSTISDNTFKGLITARGSNFFEAPGYQGIDREEIREEFNIVCIEDYDPKVKDRIKFKTNNRNILELTDRTYFALRIKNYGNIKTIRMRRCPTSLT